MACQSFLHSSSVSPRVWGGSSPVILGEKSGSTALLFQLPGEVSAIGCGSTDHFLADIVKTQTFKIYLFTRSSSHFTILECINRESDGTTLCTGPAPLILHKHGRIHLLLYLGRVGWGIASEPTGIACGRCE